MKKERWQWQGLEIADWSSCGKKEFLQTPNAILQSLQSMKLPVRIYIDHILKPELSGWLMAIQIINNNEQEIVITIKPFASDIRRRKNVLRIRMDENTKVEIPILQQ